MASALKVLTIAPLTSHSATIIFIHGLGDSGDGWKGVANIVHRTPALKHIKWILPHAGEKPITLNGGASMPAWFDIRGFSSSATEDEDGMLKSSSQINALIDEEISRGTPSDRIVLGGFSQGGAMTLLTGLTSEKKLAGLVVLSGWLPIGEKIKTMISEHAKALPIFWGHGSNDPLVLPALAERSKDFLKTQLSVPEASALELAGLSFSIYPGTGHSVDPQEVTDLKEWLTKVIPKSN